MAQADQPSHASSDTVVEFAPGLHVDFAHRVVEVEAAVVLREGPLELLACSVGTKEHESILVTQPRPLYIYQAIGMLGIEPGSPMRYDEKEDRWSPPTGERLQIDIRYRKGVEERVAPAASWLVDAKTGQPPKDVQWLFAGSRTFEEDRFGADLEGTVICVVNFDTALICLNALHTADNEALWLAANTQQIPAKGTRCTLLIRSTRPPEADILLDVTAAGRLKQAGAEVTPQEAHRRYNRVRDQDGRVLLAPAEGCTADEARAAVDRLVEAGVPRTAIRILNTALERPAERPPDEATPPAPPGG